MVSNTDATDDYVTSLGMETTLTPGHTMTMDNVTKEPKGSSYLWLPYVVLTFILLSLLVASFIHFHVKYRDRYVKRSVLAKAVKLGPDCITIDDDSPGKKPSRNVYPEASFQRVPSRTKTRRLKMFYGNKVDVGSVVVKSMFPDEFGAGQYNEGLDLSEDGDTEMNHMGDERYYHMDGTPRATLQIPKRTLNAGTSSSKQLTVSQKPQRPKYGVSIWSTAAAAKKHNTNKDKAQTGL